MTELKHENITIDKKIKNTLIDTAKNSRLETVFILFGHDKITHILQLENDSSNRFYITKEQTREIFNYSFDNKIPIVAIFHSHPKTSAYPSNLDIKSMNKSNYIWIIYSKLNQNMLGYKFTDRLERVKILEIEKTLTGAQKGQITSEFPELAGKEV